MSKNFITSSNNCCPRSFPWSNRHRIGASLIHETLGIKVQADLTRKMVNVLCKRPSNFHNKEDSQRQRLGNPSHPEGVPRPPPAPSLEHDPGRFGPCLSQKKRCLSLSKGIAEQVITNLAPPAGPGVPGVGRSRML